VIVVSFRIYTKTVAFGNALFTSAFALDAIFKACTDFALVIGVVNIIAAAVAAEFRAAIMSVALGVDTGIVAS